MLSKANLEIYQGDDYQGTVTVSDGVSPPDQVIAGFTAQAQIRNGSADKNSAVVIQIVTSVSSPYVNLSIPRAQTVTLKKSPYAWDLQLTAADGSIQTILAGQVIVTPEVTRP
jgi:hypothetical protein